MLKTLLKFQHINYYFLIKSTRDTHLKLENMKLICHKERIFSYMWWNVHFFQFPHASLSGLHCVHFHNPITCALTGQEHTLLFFFYLLGDGIFNCYNIKQCLYCMPITSSVQWGSPIFGQHWGISCCMRDTTVVRWRSTLVGKVTNTVISSFRREYFLDSVFEEHCARTICLMESYDIKTGCLFFDQDDRSKGWEKDHEDIDIWRYSAWQVW